ncbi:hypothetical protein Q5698_12795 [Brucella intermedia]|nr:hypothetical protein [Brucella intermedia]WLF97842.1 hypothetical protein Q5698_12795 [Brucella intermedia]
MKASILSVLESWPPARAKLSDLLRIDLGNGQSCGLQGGNDMAFVTAGRLKDQPFDPLQRDHKGEKISNTCRGVLIGGHLAIGQNADIQR